MPCPAGPACRWRVEGSRLPPTGTWVKSWPRVTALRAGLPFRPASRVSTKAPDGRQLAGGETTTPRGSARNAFSKWTKDSAASSCSAPRAGSAGWAVKRALSVESAAAAGTVDPWPRSSVKGWAKV